MSVVRYALSVVCTDATIALDIRFRGDSFGNVVGILKTRRRELSNSRSVIITYGLITRNPMKIREREQYDRETEETDSVVGVIN